MTPATQKTSDLIRELLERFIDHPRTLTIEPREHPGCVYWTMQCHADDFSKLVGKSGAHYNALKLLLAEIGRAADTQYVLKRYLEPAPAPRRESMARKRIVSYDPIPATELLERLLATLNVGDFAIDTHPDLSADPIAFTFAIHMRSSDDYNTLTIPREDSANPMTIIGALGTLFRAYANRDGVKFILEVKRA